MSFQFPVKPATGLFLFLLNFLITVSVQGSQPNQFIEARQIWPAGREKELNLFVGFQGSFRVPAAGDDVHVRITAGPVYRLYVNNTFCGYGPARGPHGHARVDIYPISDHLQPGENTVRVEVAGYNCNSFYFVNEPSFLQAEVLADGQVLLASGADGDHGFTACILPHRIQRVQRTSFQRTFSEAYKLGAGYRNWSKSDPAAYPKTEVTTTSSRALLERGVPHPRYTKLQPQRTAARGTLRFAPPEHYWADRSLVNIGPNFIGFKPEDLELCISRELQNWSSGTKAAPPHNVPPEPAFSANSPAYQILDFGRNLTGFVGATFDCTTQTRVFLSFDELLRDGDVDFLRLGMVNAIALDLEPGSYELESFEPYTLRYLKLNVVSGDCSISNVYLREYSNDDVWESDFACSNPQINEVWSAGLETFRQNSVDLFMDCPSRERAGWLCDSFFTARAARDLCSSTTVEHNFLQNFLIPKSFEHLPKGMLPMCYPADHPDKAFIPNWALWIIVQLEEYETRTGDRALIEAFRPKVMALLEYFKPFRNSDGLLEKLEGWIFVEWSDASKFLQDVNYPTNMLYAGAMDAAGRMYGMHDLSQQAARLREVIRQQSYDGSFFVDNAVRRNGRLEVTTNTSEVCQYYAFFFDIAEKDTHAKLWETLRRDFGMHRDSERVYPEVPRANAFIGNTLRLELLARFGHGEQMLREAAAYLGPMADRTGTLWEQDAPVASCNHGFASHICHLLIREALGIQKIDPRTRIITVRRPTSGLNWAQGRTRTPDGPVTVLWGAASDSCGVSIEAPAGYKIVFQAPAQ